MSLRRCRKLKNKQRFQIHRLRWLKNTIRPSGELTGMGWEMPGTPETQTPRSLYSACYPPIWDVEERQLDIHPCRDCRAPKVGASIITKVKFPYGCSILPQLYFNMIMISICKAYMSAVLSSA